MRLSAREHALKVVYALPHNLDILQTVLSSLGPSECQNGSAALQPPHMHL